MLEHLPRIHKALGSIPSIIKRRGFHVTSTLLYSLIIVDWTGKGYVISGRPISPFPGVRKQHQH
jgi:hypothetical protein